MAMNSSSINESIVPEEIVVSGDYSNAQKILAKGNVTVENMAEQFYRLGNRFYNAKQKHAAELAWQKSGILSGHNKKGLRPSNRFVQNIKKLHLQTVGAVLIVAVSFYVLIFTLFERQPEPFQFRASSSFSGERSFWDEWWDTGRPVNQSMRRRYGAEELWPLLKETFKNLFESEKKEVFDDIQEKLKRWLELAQSPHFRGGPTDYYALTARGLFEAREFDEALSTLNNGLYYAESPTQIEHLYQDLGTVHYYKGYKLQPDGLALYDLNDVRNSVESYEKALRFGEDPYLYGNLGWGYYLLGDYALSVENSLKALVLKPELNYARMNLGIAYIRQGAFESAYSAYASLLGYSPELDEYQGGIRDLLELQQEFPGVYPFSNFVLGQLYRQHGRNMQAREAWRKFLSRKFPVPYWQDKTRKLLREMEAE
jgi:tetratricopeptide (TPR) repeat protein